MTDLESKAASTQEMIRASEATGAYRLQTTELVDCNDITETGEFPKFGDWAEVTTLGTDGSDHEEAYLEMPGNLAKALVDLGISDGDQFVIESIEKDEDGQWTFEAVKPTDAENFMS